MSFVTVSSVFSYFVTSSSWFNCLYFSEIKQMFFFLVNYLKAAYATGQNDRQTEILSGQKVILAGHCSLTCSYFESWIILFQIPLSIFQSPSVTRKRQQILSSIWSTYVAVSTISVIHMVRNCVWARWKRPWSRRHNQIHTTWQQKKQLDIRLFLLRAAYATGDWKVFTDKECKRISHLNDGMQESNSIEGGLPLRHVSHIQLVLGDSSVSSL